MAFLFNSAAFGVLFCTASQITRIGECAHLPQVCTRAVQKLTNNYHGYLKWKRQDRENHTCKKKNATLLTAVN